MALGDGYNTVFGTNGGLSGEQVQRVQIARAFAVIVHPDNHSSGADVLIMDEATSALGREKGWCWIPFVRWRGNRQGGWRLAIWRLGSCFHFRFDFVSRFFITSLDRI